MKKNIALFLTLVLIININSCFAQTITTAEADMASKSATTTEKETKDFKEKVVNALNKQHKDNNRAVAGVVQEAKASLIKVKSDDESVYDIKIDDLLTKFYQIAGAQKKEIKVQDIKKGVYIIVTGVLSENSVIANVIYIDEQYLVKSGKVTEVNKTDFFLKVMTTDKDSYTLDVETYSKQQLLNIKTLELEKIGFSKIKEGDTIHFVVKKTGLEKEPNRYSMQKFLIIPQEYFIK